MGKLVLQIYEGDTPLTRVEIGRIIHGLKDTEIRKTANTTYDEGGDKLPVYCDNKRHDFYRKWVGGGICIARKYKRCGLSSDQICSSCESKVITDTLNYMFDMYYDGRYRAAWRKTKVTSRSKPPREKAATKKRGEAKKKEQQDILCGLEDKPKPKRKKVAPKDNQKKQKAKKEPKQEKKLAVTRTRKVSGRPRIRQVEAA